MVPLTPLVNSVNSVNHVNSVSSVYSINSVISVNSFSAVLPPSPMVFLKEDRAIPLNSNPNTREYSHPFMRDGRLGLDPV